MQMTSVWDLLYEVLRCCSLAVEYTLYDQEVVGSIPAEDRAVLVIVYIFYFPVNSAVS